MEVNLMVDYIVQEVLKRLEESAKEKKKKALVIVNGGTANLEQVLLELGKIKREYDLEVIFSESGKDIVGEERFKNFAVKKDAKLENANSLLEDCELILLPLLTKNSCAKVAVGIRDNLITYLISKGILAGKKIVAVSDSCIVKSESEYGKQLNLNIKKLQSYGIIFVESYKLAEYVLNDKTAEVVQLRNKKIITVDDIFDLKNKKVIVSKNSIITTLAKEKAQEYGITFEQEK